VTAVPLQRSRGIVCVVSDRRRLAPAHDDACQLLALIEQARAAASAGADLFQVRESDLTDSELLRVTSDVLAAVGETGMQVLVNDRLDVALASGAHGVHLKGTGIPDGEARRLAPPGFLIGRSVHTAAEAARASAAVDFVVFGTVYATASKRPNHPFSGLGPLVAAVRAATVPVLAIGGIDAMRAKEIAGVAAGVAAISWFATSDRVRLAEAVRQARAAFDSTGPLDQH
jgi:thiamine-phosphate pyrophosphorylase